LEHQQKASQLKKRIVFGLGIGITVGGVVLAGGWVFTVGLAAVIFSVHVSILSWLGVVE
jgi:phosphatidate cytidylyltransferase